MRTSVTQVAKAATLKELLVGAALDNLALLEHHDQVGGADGAQAVGDDDAGAGERLQVGVDARLRDDVQVTGRFVKEEHDRIGRQGARERQALPLPAGEPDASLGETGVVAHRRAGDLLVERRLPRRLPGRFPGELRGAEPDVLADRAAEEERLLRHDPELPPDGPELQLGKGMPSYRISPSTSA